MNRGLFVSLEGPDGSGKSTQMALLGAYLKERGYSAVVTREPGGTVISEKIRELLLDKKYSEMNGRTEALLYAAARAQHVEDVIKPALSRGDIVLCDRFADSSVVYQGYGRKLGGKIDVINEFAAAGCVPDITFLFKIDPKIGKSRIKADRRDRLESEQAEFYDEILRGYAELESRYPGRIVGIDASRSIEAIHEAIKERLDLTLREKYDL